MPKWVKHELNWWKSSNILNSKFISLDSKFEIVDAEEDIYNSDSLKGI